MTTDKNRNAIRFGREITRSRRNAGITQSRLARQVDVSTSHLSNIERGLRAPTPTLVGALDHALGEDGRLIRVWDDLTGAGRPAWLDELAQLERDAVSIQEFQLALVPAVLQTEDYARAITRLTSPWARCEEIESRVRDRTERARRFAHGPTPFMWIVLDEAVITRTIGSREVMKAQLDHIAALARDGRIAVQIVTGQHPGLSGQFKIIVSNSAPDIVYAESPHSGQVIDESADVHRFRLLFGSLQAAALPPGESLRMVEERVEGLSDE